jgi:hypothetical protein
MTYAQEEELERIREDILFNQVEVDEITEDEFGNEIERAPNGEHWALIVGPYVLELRYMDEDAIHVTKIEDYGFCKAESPLCIINQDGTTEKL